MKDEAPYLPIMMPFPHPVAPNISYSLLRHVSIVSFWQRSTLRACTIIICVHVRYSRRPTRAVTYTRSCYCFARRDYERHVTPVYHYLSRHGRATVLVARDRALRTSQLNPRLTDSRDWRSEWRTESMTVHYGKCCLHLRRDSSRLALLTGDIVPLPNGVWVRVLAALLAIPLWFLNLSVIRASKARDDAGSSDSSERKAAMYPS